MARHEYFVAVFWDLDGERRERHVALVPSISERKKMLATEEEGRRGAGGGVFILILGWCVRCRPAGKGGCVVGMGSVG